MSDEPVDPLVTASRKYNELVQYAQRVAAAADYHPNIPFENDSTPIIGDKNIEYESEDEALAELRKDALFLSEAWKEAQDYFEGSFRNEFIGYHGGKAVSREQEEAYRELIDKMEMTEMELWKLNEAVSHVLQSPPSDEECVVKLESKSNQDFSDQDEDVPDKGDFF